jgi:hypothetical protein
MKLIKISNHIDTYINADFVTRIWIEENKHYCELLSKSVYNISKDAYVKILEYDKKASE